MADGKAGTTLKIENLHFRAEPTQADAEAALDQVQGDLAPTRLRRRAFLLLTLIEKLLSCDIVTAVMKRPLKLSEQGIISMSCRFVLSTRAVGLGEIESKPHGAMPQILLFCRQDKTRKTSLIPSPLKCF